MLESADRPVCLPGREMVVFVLFSSIMDIIIQQHVLVKSEFKDDYKRKDVRDEGVGLFALRMLSKI